MGIETMKLCNELAFIPISNIFDIKSVLKLIVEELCCKMNYAAR